MKKNINKLILLIMFSIFITSFSACSNKEIFFQDGTSQSISLYSTQEFTIISETDIKDKVSFKMELNGAEIRHKQINNTTLSITPIKTGNIKIIAELGKQKTTLDITVIAIPLGTGSEQEPFLIYDKRQLIEIANSDNEYENKYFKLMSNIEFDDNEWTKPIHDMKYENGVFVPKGFKGTFDGNYKTIDFKTTKSNSFIDVNYGIIKKLKIKANIELKKDTAEQLSEIGLIAGINFGQIQESIAEGTIFNELESHAVGGIAGANVGTIINCLSNVNLILTSNETIRRVGGITGLMMYQTNINSEIKNCIFRGSLTYFDNSNNNWAIGAITGQRENESQIIKNCYYDLAAIDGRTETQLTDFIFPEIALGLNKIGDTELSNLNLENISGVSNWAQVNFNDWNNEIWNFNDSIPTLKNY